MEKFTPHQERVKVAQINFAFNNKPLLDLLEERGQAIKESDRQLQDRIETKILKLIRMTNKQL